MDLVEAWEEREWEAYEARANQLALVHEEACRVGSHDFTCSCGCGEPAAMFDDLTNCRWCGAIPRETGVAVEPRAELDWQRRDVRSEATHELSWVAPGHE